MYIIYRTYTGYIHAATLLILDWCIQKQWQSDTRMLYGSFFTFRAGNTNIWQVFFIMKWKKYIFYNTINFIQFYKSVTKQRLEFIDTLFIFYVLYFTDRTSQLTLRMERYSFLEILSEKNNDVRLSKLNVERLLSIIS